MSDYLIHPSLLDACFQLLISTLPASAAVGDAYLPVRLEELQLLTLPPPDTVLWAHAMRRSDGNDYDVINGDLRLLDPDGQLIFAATGLEMQRFGAGQLGPKDLLFEIQWHAGQLVPLQPKTCSQSLADRNKRSRYGRAACRCPAP